MVVTVVLRTTFPQMLTQQLGRSPPPRGWDGVPAVAFPCFSCVRQLQISLAHLGPEAVLRQRCPVWGGRRGRSAPPQFSEKRCHCCDPAETAHRPCEAEAQGLDCKCLQDHRQQQWGTFRGTPVGRSCLTCHPRIAGQGLRKRRAAAQAPEPWGALSKMTLCPHSLDQKGTICTHYYYHHCS